MVALQFEKVSYAPPAGSSSLYRPDPDVFFLNVYKFFLCMYGHAAAAALVKTACALRRVILSARVVHSNEKSGKIKDQPTDLDHFFRASEMASGATIYFVCRALCKNRAKATNENFGASDCAHSAVAYSGHENASLKRSHRSAHYYSGVG